MLVTRRPAGLYSFHPEFFLIKKTFFVVQESVFGIVMEHCQVVNHRFEPSGSLALPVDLFFPGYY